MTQRSNTALATDTLVVGAGGLLGGAVVREIRATLGENPLTITRTPWRDSDAARGHLHGHLANFFRINPTSRKTVYWAAGIATVRSSPEQVRSDAAHFRGFLESIDDVVVRSSHTGGLCLVFASSIGGLFGAAKRPPFDEASEPQPGSLYGESKLALEQHLAKWSHDRGYGSLLARVSSLYGEQQNAAKAQGFLTHLMTNVAHRKPTDVFVPLQTIRNYVYADDAARLIVCHSKHDSADVRIANICAPSDSTLANVIETVRDVTKLRVIIREVRDSRSAKETLDLRARSKYGGLVSECCRTSLATGARRVFDAELARFRRPSNLAQPPPNRVG